MKTKFRRLKKISYILNRTVIFLFKTEIWLGICLILRNILNAVIMFPSMYLIKYTIDALVNKIDLYDYIFIVVLISAATLGLNILILIFNSIINIKKQEFDNKVNIEIASICMLTNYKNFFDKDFIKNFEETKNILAQDVFSKTIEDISKLFTNLIVIVFSLIILFTAANFLLVLIIPVIICVLINLYASYKSSSFEFEDKKLRIEYNRKSNYIFSLANNFEYAKEIRLFSMQDGVKKYAEEANTFLLRKRKKSKIQYTRVSLILQKIGLFILECCIYGIMGYSVLILKLISVGDFSLCVNAIKTIFNRTSDTIATYTYFLVFSESIDVLFQFLDCKQQYAETEKGLPVDIDKEHEFTFKDVSFRYPNTEKNAINKINFTFKTNDHLLLVGENGSGKTTLVNLLMRIYEPSEGQILLNGIDYRQYSLTEYRKLFSSLFQDYKLFALTLNENITVASNNIDEAKLENSIKTANIYNKITNLQKKGETPLYRIFDNEGLEMSGGEMQCFALARTVYKNSPIIILDEPTSALDAKNEHIIYSSFNNVNYKKSTIYISHRLSSSKFCDNIIVLKNGSIAESGTHQGLMNHKGEYCRLYEMQANLYNEEEMPSEII